MLVGSAVLVSPYLLVCTNYTIFTLIPSSTILWTSSNSSLDVVLFFNWVFSIYWSILAQIIICSQKQVGIMVVGSGPHQGNMVCPKYLYMQHLHRVSVILQIFHDPIWGLIEYGNACSNYTIHLVSRSDHKMEIQETGLYIMIFSQFFVIHIFCLEHDTYV